MGWSIGRTSRWEVYSDAPELRIDREDRGNYWQRQVPLLGYEECSFTGFQRDTFIQLGVLYTYDQDNLPGTGYLKLYVDGKVVARINDNYQVQALQSNGILNHEHVNTWDGIELPSDVVTLTKLDNNVMRGPNELPKLNELRIGMDRVGGTHGEFALAEIALFNTQNTHYWDDLAFYDHWSINVRNGKFPKGGRHMLAGAQAVLASRIGYTASGLRRVPRTYIYGATASLNRNVSEDLIIQWNRIGENPGEVHPYGGNWFDPDTCIVVCDPPQPPPTCNLIDLGFGYYASVEIKPLTGNAYVGGTTLKRLTGYRTTTTVLNSNGQVVTNVPFQVRQTLNAMTVSQDRETITAMFNNNEGLQLKESDFYTHGEWEKLVALAEAEMAANAQRARAEYAEYAQEQFDAGNDGSDPDSGKPPILVDPDTLILTLDGTEICYTNDPFCMAEFSTNGGYWKSLPQNTQRQRNPFQSAWTHISRKPNKKYCL